MLAIGDGTECLLGQVCALSQPERGQHSGVDVREGNDSPSFQRAEKCEHEKDIHGDGKQRDNDHLKIAKIELSEIVVSEVVEQSRNLILRQFGILARCPHRFLNLVGGDALGGSEGKRTRAGQEQKICGDVDACEKSFMQVP